MLANPAKDCLRFLVHLTKNFPARSTTWNDAVLPFDFARLYISDIYSIYVYIHGCQGLKRKI